IFTSALHYDLDHVELVFTILIALIGGCALLLVAGYLLTRRGTTAQDGLAFLLFLMPILLGIAGVIFFKSLITWSPPAGGVDGEKVLSIYLRSAARLLP